MRMDHPTQCDDPSPGVAYCRSAICVFFRHYKPSGGRGNAGIFVASHNDCSCKCKVVFLAVPGMSIAAFSSPREKTVCAQDWALPVNLNRLNFLSERLSCLTREPCLQTFFSTLPLAWVHCVGRSLSCTPYSKMQCGVFKNSSSQEDHTPNDKGERPKRGFSVKIRHGPFLLSIFVRCLDLTQNTFARDCCAGASVRRCNHGRTDGEQWCQAAGLLVVLLELTNIGYGKRESFCPCTTKRGCAALLGQ